MSIIQHYLLPFIAILIFVVPFFALYILYLYYKENKSPWIVADLFNHPKFSFIMRKCLNASLLDTLNLRFETHRVNHSINPENGKYRENFFPKNIISFVF